MYQMICPVLERLQAMEGGDASDGAGTGTEIDEVRGGLRAHPSGWLEPGGGGGGSGCLGAHLPALAQLGIELIPAYSPEARGRSERMFGTLQKRLPQELRLAGITDMVEANRFLKEVFLPQHNARFATPAEDRGTAFVPFTGALDDILCIHEERTVSNDNTVRYKRLALQIPAGRHRRHYVKARVRVHEYPDGTMAVFHGPRCLARYHADGQPIDSQTREAA